MGRTCYRNVIIDLRETSYVIAWQFLREQKKIDDGNRRGFIGVKQIRVKMLQR